MSPVDIFIAREKLAAAAAAYCARHEEISRVTADDHAAPACEAIEGDIEVGDYETECHERFDCMKPGHERGDCCDGHPRWWEVSAVQIAELCVPCQERVARWALRRRLRAGIGGLKKAMLAAYRRLA